MSKNTKKYTVVKLTGFVSLLIITNLSIAQSYVRDVKMGDRAAKQVEQEMGIYKHDSLEKLINAIGQKLVNNLEKKPTEFTFIFYLVDTDVPNAFALPGGHVYVTRGILPLVQNEDELAGIMGHEIIHVVNRHSVKQVNREIVPAVLKIPGNIVNALTFSHLGSILNLPIDFITSPFIASYSRKHEREADEEGIKLAQRSGYRPEALAAVLARLSKGIEVLTGQKEKRSYLADHPYTPKRVEDINKQFAKYGNIVEKSTIYPSNQKFLEQFNGLCYGSNPKNGVFVDTLFVHPELQFSMIMPSGWNHVNEQNIVASSPKTKDAIVSLAITDGKRSPAELGKEMATKISKSPGTTLLFSADTIIHSNPAYLIRFSNLNKGKTAIMEFIYVSYNNQVYQLSGFSYAEKTNVTAKTIRSFKAATSEESSKVMIPEIKIVLAKNNESIADLSIRSGNKLNEELTQIYNDCGAQLVLSENKSVKIVQTYMYKSN
jgi:predicted Zn-dependent protease